MNNIYKSIYNEIKKYKKIYIARHIGPDPDAYGSQMALKEAIKLSFKDKEVYAVGTSVSRFKYFGKIDKVDNYDYENGLLIVTDTQSIIYRQKTTGSDAIYDAKMLFIDMVKLFSKLSK